MFNTDVDKSVLKAKKIFEDLDPIALTCLYQMAIASKSTAVAMCALFNKISIEDAVKASRTDEEFQIEKFGLVEGAHDLDESFMFTTYGAAKSLINLA